ncbi:hypothetical protein BLNAU_7150 [Blattamonas nauphoetae]|uniref:Uncharacterized protein n=1 Tax=Blattamonas nauphoetae TaxID=2049346 RepID=A0ABQ9Y2L3_9EUKA|nr:hypothetical protein BLNAU_7150 [Blattamonas nauphoetae]
MLSETTTSTSLSKPLEPNFLSDINQASSVFLSFTEFISKGGVLDDAGTERMCQFLKRITVKSGSTFNSEQILHELVPTPDGSCEGFSQRMVPLLTCLNTKIVLSVLHFFVSTLVPNVPLRKYQFIETRFFTRLPQPFLENDVHLTSQHDSSFMTLVRRCLECASPTSVADLFFWKQVTPSIIRQTVFDSVVKPLRPFWTFVCQNWQRITDHQIMDDYPHLLGALIQISPFHEETAQFVLSSQICETSMSCLGYFELSNFGYILVNEIICGMENWNKEDQAVRQRGQTILVKMKEEGLTDLLELQIRLRLTRTNIAAQLIHMLGGNCPFKVERIN